MSDSLKTLLVIAFLIVIVWNLGAGLYYLLVDRGQTKRTVNALTRRIAVSVALILLVIVSIYMRARSKHVDEHEEHQPHHVDEVPVPRGRFKTEMVVAGEVSLGRTQPHHDQHDRAQQHVRAVEAGQHEER